MRKKNNYNKMCNVFSLIVFMPNEIFYFPLKRELDSQNKFKHMMIVENEKINEEERKNLEKLTLWKQNKLDNLEVDALKVWFDNAIICNKPNDTVDIVHSLLRAVPISHVYIMDSSLYPARYQGGHL